MRHRVAKKHLSRTPAHLKAMRRNMAQSLFQHGELRTTVQKAKALRPFVERLVTLARQGTLHSRQRVTALMGDRSILTQEEEEKYADMSDAQRHKVMTARSGRRHRAGRVPAAYNKKKIPFVAQSIVHKLMTEIAPIYKDRPGGYTRIIHLADRRIGDNSDLAILQLVGFGEDKEAKPSEKPGKKTIGLRRRRTLDRVRFLEGKEPRRAKKRGGGMRKAGADEIAVAATAAKAADPADSAPSKAADTNAAPDSQQPAKPEADGQ